MSAASKSLVPKKSPFTRGSSSVRHDRDETLRRWSGEEAYAQQTADAATAVASELQTRLTAQKEALRDELAVISELHSQQLKLERERREKSGADHFDLDAKQEISAKIKDIKANLQQRRASDEM
eukprot:4670549-Prymnesium_polylepis.1